MYYILDMPFESQSTAPDFGSIKMYFIGTAKQGYFEEKSKKFRKYTFLSQDLSKLNLITNALQGSTAEALDTGDTYYFLNDSWQKIN